MPSYHNYLAGLSLETQPYTFRLPVKPPRRPDLRMPASTGKPIAAQRRLILTNRRPVSEREAFFFFVRVLLKCIELDGGPQLKLRANAVIKECTRRNRAGDSRFFPLKDSIEFHLRRTVGELHWARAKRYFVSYCRRNGLETLLMTAF